MKPCIWSVPPAWKGETCVILAGGPSLNDVDLSPLWRTRVIAINDSWRQYPLADVFYFCDPQWWLDQELLNLNSLSRKGYVTSFEEIKGRFWVSGSEPFENDARIQFLKLTGQTGLETNPTGLRHGSNSGYQAANLAYHFGVKKIILLGYDMRVVNGRTHWHSERREPAEQFAVTLSHSMLPLFETLRAPLQEAGVEVINATPDSALKVWPYVPLEEALGLCGAA